MAYGLKYELLCSSKKNAFAYKLKLSFDGYTGAEINRNMPRESALLLRKDKAAVIRGTSLEFGIREAVDFEMDEFYSNNPKKIKAQLYKDTTLLWAGYNLPQQYNAPYISAPLTIRFTATDGLGLLKNEDFNLTGRNSQLATIVYCIDKIGLGLGYSIAINLFETTHSHDRSPLEQTYEDAATFNGLNCYAVIENILNKYDAEITQVNARWHITRSTDKKSTRMLYTAAGVYDTTSAAPAVLDLGYPGTGIEVSPVGQLSRSMEPGAKKVTITHTFGRKSSFLNNYEFWRFAGGQFTGWTQNGAGTLLQKIKDGKAYARLVGYSNDDSEGIYQSIPVTNVANQDFVFEIDFAPIGRSAGSGGGVAAIMMTVRMAITINDGSTIYYLTKTGWTTTPTIISETVKAGLISPIWNRMKIITDELPCSGTMTVQLYRYYLSTSPRPGDSYSGIDFSEPLIYFLNAGELYPSGLKTTAVFDNSTEPNDLGTIDLKSADAPALTNAGQLYDYITRLSDDTPTIDWHVLGEGTAYSQVVQLARVLASNNRTARDKLSGAIKTSTTLSFNSIIKHTYNASKEFEISEGTWDLYNETWQVILLELLAWSSEDVTFTTESDNEGRSTNASSDGAIIGAGAGNESGAYSLAAADLLAALITVDGAGSGLDADLLDGQHGSFYAPIDSPIFITQITAPLIYGGSAANGDINIKGTSDATKTGSCVLLQADGGNVGVGVADALRKLHLAQDKNASFTIAAFEDINTTNGNGPVVSFRGTTTGAGGAAFVEFAGFQAYYVEHNHATRKGAFDIFSTNAGVFHDFYFSPDGNFGVDFTSPLSKVCINGGLHVGGESDAGDNNLLVDGTIKGESLESTTTFSAGFAGDGYKISETGGVSSLEVDNLIVRRALKVFELQINKLSAINGGLIISCANGKSIGLTGTTKIWFDTNGGLTPIQFIDNDWIRAQQWDNGVKYFQAQVTADIGSDYIVVDNVTGTPWATMDLVQVGHPTNTARQSIIYITAADTNNPYIQMLSGVTDGNFSAARTKVLLGNLTPMASTGIVPATPGFGLFSDNVYITGSVSLPTAGMTNEGSAAGSIRIYAGDTYANRAIAPFRVTQDGSLTATGIAELGTSAVDIGGYMGSLAIKGGAIWENALNTDEGSVIINYEGYAGGTTKYRDFLVFNGKYQLIAEFNGSARSTSFSGPVYASGLAHIEGGLRIGTYGGVGEPGTNNLYVDGTIVCASSITAIGGIYGNGGTLSINDALSVSGSISGTSLYAGDGATGSFTTVDSKTVTVTNGIVTNIV